VRKLLKDSKAKIETNRGMGYRLTSLWKIVFQLKTDY
jgi:hypothetical protein